MTCIKFELYVSGEMSPDEFKEHMRECEPCRKAYELDKTIMRMARETEYMPAENEMLWHSIESSLAVGKKTRRFIKPLYRVAAAAVVIVAVVSMFRYVHITYRVSHARFLASAELDRVEHIEQEYEKAIDALEKHAEPSLNAMDFELALLYKDKLKTIDTQIQECRIALDSNPGSGRIRRYMLTAMRDKKETLAEIARHSSTIEPMRKSII